MSTPTPFERLHPALRHHIVHALGWSSLREVQQGAIGPILAGDNLVILAPTAGGKTEAAFFPLLTRLLDERWPGLSILYLSPIRALLNNQHARLERLCGLVGHRAGIWHGDVTHYEKRRARQEPPSVLLTTPESLEAMLISTRTSAQAMFSDLRAVVIDEVHAFAGADRGWHLVGVLSRLCAWAGRDLQRVGLSATVGDPPAITDWLSAGSRRPRHTLTSPPPPDAATPEVTLDWVASLPNAARVIEALHRGQRRLVFCDSRLQAEKLTQLLRDMGQATWLTHSSLSADERRRTEAAFSEGAEGVIVSTSALELGIDIGNLDRVIGIDAPASVASFLQRMGRTGRRPGTRPNMLLLAISQPGLLRAASLLTLWREGHVEPARAPPAPFHILAQQMIALVLERPGIALDSFEAGLKPFCEAAAIDPGAASALLAHLLDTGALTLDGVRAGIGREGERALGARHFLKLVSVFTTPALFRVVHHRQELGTIDQSTFFSAHDQEGPRVILLGGRTWRVRSIDWHRRVAYVEPCDIQGTSRWIGGGADLSPELSAAHRRIMTCPPPYPEHCSRRATDALCALREEFSFLAEEVPTFTRRGDHTEVWSFAGDARHRLLADRINHASPGRAHPDGLKLTLKTDRDDTARSWWEAAQAEVGHPPVPDSHPLRRHLKFGDLLPPDLLEKTLAARLYGH